MDDIWIYTLVISNQGNRNRVQGSPRKRLVEDGSNPGHDFGHHLQSDLESCSPTPINAARFG